jgi:uncharacterized protein (DUF433 family)
MQLEDYFDFQASNDIRIKGHRVGIESILYEYIFNERSAERIAKRFPTLTLEQIYATILYYLHNKPQVDQYLSDWLEHGRRMQAEQERNPPPVVLRLRRLKAEREAARQLI